MASATPDLRLPSQPQGITAPWPIPNCTAWWQRHVCVNNLPKVVSWEREAGNRTRDLPSRKSNALATTPAGHTKRTAPPTDMTKVSRHAVMVNHLLLAYLISLGCVRIVSSQDWDLFVLEMGAFKNTQGEVTSQSLWSRYNYCHFVGITRHNALS